MPEIQAVLPTHVIVILTKFYRDKSKIVDSLSQAYFGASVIFFVTVSMFISEFQEFPHELQNKSTRIRVRSQFDFEMAYICYPLLTKISNKIIV